MALFKLMSNDCTTRNEQKWEIGVEAKKAECYSPQLCSKDVFHAYRNLNLAFLVNPIHGNFSNPIVAECEGEIVVEDWDKVGCFALTPTRWIAKPDWVESEDKDRVCAAFSILCAESVAHIYAAIYPGDHRVQAAIDAAKACMQQPSPDAARAANKAAHEAFVVYADIRNIYLPSGGSIADTEAAAAADVVRAAYSAAYSAAYCADSSVVNAAYAYADDIAYVVYCADESIDFGELADKAVEIGYNR